MKKTTKKAKAAATAPARVTPLRERVKKPPRNYPGRPRMPDAQKRSKVVGIRLNPTEEATLNELTAFWNRGRPDPLTPSETAAHLLRVRLAKWKDKLAHGKTET
jgi:hypothetical protein